MEIKVKRITPVDYPYTIGKMYIENQYFCDTLENKIIDVNKNGRFDGNEKKVYGESAIPYGRYEVCLNISPKFKRLLPRLINVPHFEGILIHRGNSPKDTAGCILVGENKKKGMVLNSTKYEEELVKKIQVALDKGEKIYISVE